MASFTDQGVIFNDVKASVHTGGSKLSAGQYIYENGNIVGAFPVINAIDIDWNQVSVPGLGPTGGRGVIGTTGELLKKLGEINDAVRKILDGTTRVRGKYDHVLLTKEEYADIDDKDPNTIYFIEDDGTGYYNGGGDSGNTNNSNTLTINNLTLNTSANQAEGTVTLEPGYKYELSGKLNGQIVIDCSGKTKEQMKAIGNTILCLNGVIINSEEDYAIMYTVPTHIDSETGEVVKNNQGFKDLVITLYRNKKNIIKCTKVVERSDDQPGAIYSMNNLTIQGAGYLGINNKGGHGIRGSEVRLSGPYMYFDVIHDAVHGKHISIDDGVLYAETCNDIVGTGDSGRIFIYGGKYVVKDNVEGDVFDSGLTGLVLSNNITILRSGSEIPTVTNMLTVTPENFKTVIEDMKSTPTVPFTLNSGVFLATLNTKGDLEISSIVELNTTTNTYYISSIPTNSVVYVKGIINNPIITTVEDTTIYLENAYITNNHSEGAIYYTNSIGKLKIFGISDSINFITNIYDNDVPETINDKPNPAYITSENIGEHGYDGIKSENNIEMEIKNNCHICITSNWGDGVDGGNVLINDSKGSLIIYNCGLRGIKANTCILGVNASVSASVNIIYYDQASNLEDDKDIDKIKYFEGAIIVKNNCVKSGVIPHDEKLNGDKAAKNYGFADIYGRNGKAATGKGIISTRSAVVDGVIITGTIGSVFQIDLDNCKEFYFVENITPSLGDNNLIGVPSVLRSTISVYNTTGDGELISFDSFGIYDIFNN